MGEEKIVTYCCDCCNEAKYKFNDIEYCLECLNEAMEESNDDKFTIYKI